jgi:Fe-S-cluster-containing hydrogenase component 2
MAKSKEQVLTLTENCIGCELCYNVCPFDAVGFETNP